MAALAAQVIILGTLLICFLAIKALLARFRIVPIVGFIFLGWLFRLSDQHFSFIPDAMPASLFLLAKIGIVFLLFHIGLESHLKRMLHFISQAGLIAIINILFSGILGFLTAQAFHFSMATSLFIGVALTATSIGVSTASWTGKDLTLKKEGTILLDLVTIDDIIGIFLMALLFSIVPLGMNHHSLGLELGLFFLKIVLFISFCYLFSYFA
ncbi:MAG: High-affinity Na(+)/H(+) antiporter NhaS3 [Chlamydiae bacterium]|nr:High-affinity Na(+)/H(+) antiporter NhaS3 [Chlamydiota bacterium]